MRKELSFHWKTRPEECEQRMGGSCDLRHHREGANIDGSGQTAARGPGLLDRYTPGGYAWLRPRGLTYWRCALFTTPTLSSEFGRLYRL